jgi:putative transposase
MKKIKSPYHGFRFPGVVICCAVRWYHRFTYESIRNWCDRFGTQFARRAKAVRGTLARAGTSMN